MPPPQTPSGKRIEQALENFFEPLDLIGQRVLGSLWRIFYESVQDAIALSLLLQIPSLIGSFILGKEFSDYLVCLKESPWGSVRYACFIIVTSDFLLWILLAGRILARFLVDFKNLWQKPKP